MQFQKVHKAKGISFILTVTMFTSSRMSNNIESFRFPCLKLDSGEILNQCVKMPPETGRLRETKLPLAAMPLLFTAAATL